MISEQTSPKLRILLIDDDPAEFTLLKRKLAKAEGADIQLDYVDGISEAVECVKAGGVDLVFLDNRLVPNNDFRETAPQLRGVGYVGPIGIISSDLSGSYFERFQEFGVDFRIGKEEIDGTAISFIIAEYTRDQLSENCAEDFL
jgi:CheY-like chemotaxis protein